MSFIHTSTQAETSSKAFLKSFIESSAYNATLLFIFMFPWGNYVFDGFNRIFGLASLGLSALLFVSHGSHRKYGIFHLLIFMYAGWVLLSVMWSPDTSSAMERAFVIVQLVLFALVYSFHFTTIKRIRMAYQAFAFGAMAGSIIIIYNYMNGILSKYWARYSIQNYEVDGIGIMLALGVICAAYLTTQYKSKLFVFINTAALPLYMFAIFLNGTRTASIVASLGLLYWLFTKRKASLPIKLMLITLLVVSIASIFAFAPKNSVSRISSSSQSASGTLNGRTIIWKAGLSQWKDAPILGYGIGSFESVVNPLHVDISSAHNSYLHVLTETGFIGFMLFIFMLISILYYIFKVPILDDKLFLLSFYAVVNISQVTMNMIYDKEAWFAFTLMAIHAYKLQEKQS